MPDPVDDRYHHGNLRSALLEAAQQTLRESGAEQLSLRDLARQVGVSHAAPRRHFADRQALIDALALEGFARLDQELTTALDAAGPGFTERLRAVADTYLHFATHDAALLEQMFLRKHGEGAERFEAAAHPAFGLMGEVMELGQEQGILRPGDPTPGGMVLLATLHGIATIINGNLAPADQLGGLVDTALEQFVTGAGVR